VLAVQTSGFGAGVSVLGVSNIEEFRAQVILFNNNQNNSILKEFSLSPFLALQVLEQKKKLKEGLRMQRDDSPADAGGSGVTVRKFGDKKGGVEVDISEFDSVEELIQSAAADLGVSKSAVLVRKDEAKVTKLKLIKPGEVLYLKE